jgi:CRP/FNR family transcriptional regulator, cyclic AMP receptor protein
VEAEVTRPVSRLSDADRDAIAAYGARATWPAGFTLYERGSRADGIFLVVRGRIVLRNRVKSGRGFIPAIIVAGETFGAEGLSAGGQYATDASAEIESETLYLGSARFRTLMREQPVRAMAIVAQVMEERTAILDRLRELATLSVEQRLVKSLTRLAQSESFTDQRGRIELTPARYRILCELVGATRESVSLVLNRLAQDELVDKSGSNLIVAPLERLQERLRGDSERSVPLAVSAEQRDYSVA